MHACLPGHQIDHIHTRVAKEDQHRDLAPRRVKRETTHDHWGKGPGSKFSLLSFQNIISSISHPISSIFISHQFNVDIKYFYAMGKHLNTHFLRRNNIL